MIIEIDRPEIETLIRERTKDGADVQEVIFQALKSFSAAELSAPSTRPAVVRQRPEGRKSLAQLFADSPFKGLDMEFGRDADVGDDIVL